MAQKTPLDRRTVLQTLSALLALCVGAQSVTATDGHTAADTLSGPQNPDSATETAETGSVSGFYGATVDRIVDGEHVVVLLENSEEVVEQLVFPRDEYPTVEEGTQLFVWVDDGGMTVLWRW
jgi:hypothetical protein